MMKKKLGEKMKKRAKNEGGKGEKWGEKEEKRGKKGKKEGKKRENGGKCVKMVKNSEKYGENWVLMTQKKLGEKNDFEKGGGE